MTRMEDKWNRLDNLTLNPENIQVKDESIEDTLIDLANYCLMTCIELEFAKKNIQKENIPVKSNKEKKAKRGTKPPIRTLPANFTVETVATTGESNE